jgi:hypothetical protein
MEISIMNDKDNLPDLGVNSDYLSDLSRGPLGYESIVAGRRNETPPRTPAPTPDRPELSKVDYILSQRNSNPGQRYSFPPGTTDEDRQYAQRMADNIGNSETFLSEFNAYKSDHGYR